MRRVIFLYYSHRIRQTEPEGEDEQKRVTAFFFVMCACLIDLPNAYERVLLLRNVISFGEGCLVSRGVMSGDHAPCYCLVFLCIVPVHM